MLPESGTFLGARFWKMGHLNWILHKQVSIADTSIFSYGIANVLEWFHSMGGLMFHFPVGQAGMGGAEAAKGMFSQRTHFPCWSLHYAWCLDEIINWWFSKTQLSILHHQEDFN